MAGPGGGGDTPADPGAPTAQAAELSPNPVAFPDTVVGETSSATLTARNPGEVGIELGGVSGHFVRTGFTLSTDGCSGQSLEPGGSCEVALSFSPPVEGDHAAQVTIDDTGTGESASVRLSGVGIPVGIPPEDEPGPGPVPEQETAPEVDPKVEPDTPPDQPIID